MRLLLRLEDEQKYCPILGVYLFPAPLVHKGNRTPPFEKQRFEKELLLIKLPNSPC